MRNMYDFSILVFEDMDDERAIAKHRANSLYEAEEIINEYKKECGDRCVGSILDLSTHIWIRWKE